LGDATEITAVISENFNAVELLGLRELMVNRDLKRIDAYEKVWRRRHGAPVIPDFVHSDQRPTKIKGSIRQHPAPTGELPESTGDQTGGAARPVQPSLPTRRQ
jgi:hypothetical protein